MKKISIPMRIMIYINLFLCLGILLLLGYHSWYQTDGRQNLEGSETSDQDRLEAFIKQENLQAALNQEDRLVDYIKDGEIIYALINREGITEFGDTFLVFTKNPDLSWNRSYENDFKGLKPWKIELGDMDGDEVKELLIAVKKMTYFDPEEKNRMFVFNYTDGVLVKRWTGSQIAGSWRDFNIGDLVDAPGSELMFIEKTAGGLEAVSIYYWFDFGFILLAKSGDYEEINQLDINGYNKLQITVREGQNIKIIQLTAKEGKLQEADD